MPRMARQSPRVRALRERQRRRERAENPLDFPTAAINFETIMRNIELKTCAACSRRVEKSAVSCGRCRTCRPTPNRLFTAQNGMDLGEVPNELSGLSLIEQILIARVHPVVSVFRIRGQQRAYSGHVINFVQHVDTFATRLPPPLTSIPTIAILNRTTCHGIIQFRVRASRVFDALVWLKRNNPYYRDVIIDDTVINSLPIDGDATQVIPNAGIIDNADLAPDHVAGIICDESVEASDREPRIDSSFFPHLPAVNQEEIIRRNIDLLPGGSHRSIGVGSWPTLSPNPVSDIGNEGLLCCAFPTLFPYGRGDLYSPRIHTIGPHAYFKYLMQYKDGRFARDERFAYYAYNSMARWEALHCGSVFVRHHHIDGLTAEDLRAMIDQPDTNIAAAIMYYGTNIRGTRSYWKQRCSELIQMVRQFGTPTVFFTLSAADYHWPDLFRLLSPEIDPSNLTEGQRAELMHQNPSLVAWFFNSRCDVFLKHFIKKLWPVTEYWYRFEWQFRGSPHIHGLLWLSDAPERDDIDSFSPEMKRDLISYFDRLVSAWIPRYIAVNLRDHPCRKRFMDLNPAARENDICQLLSSIQRHTRCGSHCMRRRRNSRALECRFGFPIEPQAESDLRRDGGSWKFYPRRNDALIQRHNKLISQAWRGNTDFSAITSKEDVINYVSKYASKAEHASEPYINVMRSLIARSDSDTSASTIARQLIISSVAERNYSAQEVMHLLNGWPLFHCSRGFEVLSLKNDWRRLGESTTVEHYSNRIGLDDLSLLEYSKRYRHRSGHDIERRQEVVVRVIPYLKLSDDAASNEEYYRLQCKLNIPWRGDFNQLRPEETSWSELYLQHFPIVEIVDPFAEGLPPADEIEFEIPQNGHESLIRDAGLALARLGPDLPANDPIGHRPIDEAEVWPDTLTEVISEASVMDFLRSYRSAPRIQPITIQAIPYSSMSSAQKEVIDICRHQYRNPTHPVKRVLVQGKAGTGKTAVIRSICSSLDREAMRAGSGKLYQVLAPTGAAAINIDGKTIHSFLRIPISSEYTPLNGENLRNFQLMLKSIKFIIFDEYSMIGMNLLERIHRRLCEASGSIEQPFGGFFVYLFGDLRQLPPVRDSAVYSTSLSNRALIGKRLMQSIQKTVVLTECHRQGTSQVAFRHVLDDLAKGKANAAGWDLLMSRRIAINRNSLAEFANEIHLYPTNELVRDHNFGMLSSNRSPVAIIEAEHNNATARQGTDAVAQGLPAILLLSHGSRVMLRKNLCVELGLVNGSLGTIRKIVYSPGNRPPTMPRLILVQFDRYAGPTYIDNCFPLLPISTSWKEANVDCTRRQFPIVLSYALTIHKAQGLTLDKVAVDIGPTETSAGLSYVALSRVKTIQGLLITKNFNLDRLTAIGSMRQVVDREAFMRQNIPEPQD